MIYLKKNNLKEGQIWPSPSLYRVTVCQLVIYVVNEFPKYGQISPEKEETVQPWTSAITRHETRDLVRKHGTAFKNLLGLGLSTRKIGIVRTTWNVLNLKLSNYFPLFYLHIMFTYDLEHYIYNVWIDDI